MAINKYPYTDFNEYNLDWIILKIKEFESELTDYEALHSITFGGDWNISKSYTQWTIVSDPITHDGYLSLQPVPPNVQITNTDYWLKIADYTTGLAAVNSRVDAVEADITDNIKPDIDAVEADITDNIKPDIDAIEADITDNIKPDIVALQGSVSDLNTLTAQTSTYLNDVISLLAARGIFSNAIEVVTVGTGQDYSSLIDAITYVTSLDEKPCIVKIYPGTYDVSLAGVRGLEIPNNCYLVGIGTNTDIHITATMLGGVQSTIYLTKNCGLYNLYIQGNGGRYTIHNDDDTHLSYSTQIIKNCVVEGSNHNFQFTIGCGNKAGGRMIVEDCFIINNTDRGCFSMHNMTGAVDAAYVVLRNCAFIAGNPGVAFPDFTLRFAGVMNYNGSAIWEYTYVTIENCQNVSINIVTEYEDPFVGKISPFNFNGNGEWSIFSEDSTPIEPAKFHNDDIFIRMRAYTATGKGKPVFKDGSLLVPGNFEQSIPQFFSGATVTDAAAAGDQLIAAKPAGQCIPKSLLGITGGNPTDVIVWSVGGSTPSAEVKAFSDASGYVAIGTIQDSGLVKMVNAFYII